MRLQAPATKTCKKRYLLVTRENEYVVLQYYIGAQYTNEWMNKYLPSPDILLIVLITAGAIFVCLFLTARFAKKAAAAA